MSVSLLRETGEWEAGVREGGGSTRRRAQNKAVNGMEVVDTL